MSIINKVLQDLDSRHAEADTVLMIDGQSESLTQHLRPVIRPRRSHELFWYTLALLMCIGFGWVGWVVWQLMPRPVVTELAYQPKKTEPAEIAKPTEAQAAAAPAPVAPAAVPAVADARTLTAMARPEAAPKPQEEKPAPAPAPSPAAAPAPTPVPAPEKPARPRAAEKAAPARAAEKPAPKLAGKSVAAPVTKAAENPAPAPAIAPVAAALPAVAAVAPTGAEPARIDMLRLATELATPNPQWRPRAAAKVDGKTSSAASLGKQSQATSGPGQIERRARTPERDRADVEFRRAAGLINQGRMAEGMDGLRKSLQMDPSYEAARQTLVALLLESRRVDEAAAVLQEGVAADPSNTGFAMLLARVMVERSDIPGALALLQKYAPANGSSADYHAFAGALHQRLGQHQQAVEEYKTALKLAPGAGIWWIGLGISQQALEQPKDALDAFKRAKASGTLAPALLSFADQRVKLLQ